MKPFTMRVTLEEREMNPTVFGNIAKRQELFEISVSGIDPSSVVWQVMQHLERLRTDLVGEMDQKLNDDPGLPVAAHDGQEATIEGRRYRYHSGEWKELALVGDDPDEVEEWEGKGDPS